MILYRGVKDILIARVDPLFIDKSNELLTYGYSTSYSYQEDLAKEYSLSFQKFGLVLKYEVNPANMFFLNESHFMDEENLDEGLFIDREFIETFELSEYLIKKGYDSCYFELEDFPHVLLLNTFDVSNLTLIEVGVRSDDVSLIQEVMKVGSNDFKGLDKILFKYLEG